MMSGLLISVSIRLLTSVYCFSVPPGVFFFFVKKDNSCLAPADAAALSSLCVISEMAGGWTNHVSIG